MAPYYIVTLRAEERGRRLNVEKASENKLLQNFFALKWLTLCERLCICLDCNNHIYCYYADDALNEQLFG